MLMMTSKYFALEHYGVTLPPCVSDSGGAVGLSVVKQGLCFTALTVIFQ
jgi:hypothetical protein